MENGTISEGCSQLRGAVEQQGESGVDVARKCKVTAAQISRILSGDRLPGRTLAVAFRDHYGVEPALWDQPAKRHGAKVATTSAPAKRRARPAAGSRRKSARPGGRASQTSETG